MGAGKETKQTHDGWLSAGIGCFCEQVSRCHSIYRYQQNASAHFRTLSNPHRIEIRADVEAAGRGGYEIKVLEKLGPAEYNARQSAVQQWLRQGAIPLNTVIAGGR